MDPLRAYNCFSSPFSCVLVLRASQVMLRSRTSMSAAWLSRPLPPSPALPIATAGRSPPLARSLPGLTPTALCSTLRFAPPARSMPPTAASLTSRSPPPPPPPPPPPTPPSAPPPGTVLVQWQLQPNGTVKEPGSWATGGSLPASGLTDGHVLGLSPVPQFASMLFVLAPVSVTATDASADAAAASVAAGGKKGAAAATAAPDATALPPVSGERTFPVELVQQLLRRVKALRNRLESPRQPTDLFGEDAPSPEELAKLRSAINRSM